LEEVFASNTLKYANLFAELLYPYSDDLALLEQNINGLLTEEINPGLAHFLKDKKDYLSKLGYIFRL